LQCVAVRSVAACHELGPVFCSCAPYSRGACVMCVCGVCMYMCMSICRHMRHMCALSVKGVYVYVFVSVFMCLSVQVRGCALRQCVAVCSHIYTHTHTCLRTHALCKSNGIPLLLLYESPYDNSYIRRCTYTPVYVHTHTSAYTQTSVYVDTHTHLYTHTHTCVHTHIHISTYTHTPICVHTYTHTSAYTHTRV